MSQPWPCRAHPPPAADGPPGPLAGCTIVWTRPAESARDMAQALAQAGAEVIEAPAIELAAVFAEENLQQCRRMLDALREKQGWLILPSPAAIRYFGEILARMSLDAAALAGTRVAVVGEASARHLAAIGLQADFIPPSPSGRTLAETLPAEPGTPVVIAGSSQTRPELREGLAARGLSVQALPLYAPRPCQAGLKAIGEALAQAPGRVVVVTSPSAVDAMMEAWGENGWPLLDGARWVAIGPTTWDRLLKWKIAPARAAQATAPDAEGIIGAVQVLIARSNPPEDSIR